MTIRVLLFAAAAESIGKRYIDVDCPSGSTVQALAQRTIDQYPQLASLMPISRWAVDQSFVDPHSIVHSGQEVAFIPPVSGG